MDTISDVVSLLEKKLIDLIEKFDFLKNENELLHNKIAILEAELAKERELVNVRNKKYQALKIAKTIEGSVDDRRETKLKINALIREVDICINQLSE